MHKLQASLIPALAILALGCEAAPPTTAPTDSAAKPAEASKPAPASKIAAFVGERTITIADLDAAAESQLKQLEMQRYQARKSALDSLVQQTLVEQEAKKLGLSPQDLIKQEVLLKVTTPSDEDVKAYYEANKSRIEGEFDAIAPRIRQHLAQQAAGVRQREFLGALRKATKVSIELEPPRVEVATTGSQSKGDPEAPIQLIEFSDYQCPYCSRSQGTVNRILEAYEGKVHHIFMDFPLKSIHPQAAPAAAAAHCAGDQGKFWEFHDALFEKQREIASADFAEWAKELELDVDKFKACVDAGTHLQRVDQQMAIGQAAGVSGTPAFFINGIFINGAQPFENFQQTIDAELDL